MIINFTFNVFHFKKVKKKYLNNNNNFFGRHTSFSKSYQRKRYIIVYVCMRMCVLLNV